MNFKELGIAPEVLKALEDLGFTEPTTIQEKTIPSAIKGHDIIAGSATGSGKTLAFGASIIQFAEPGNGITALILTPTRELAEQIKDNMNEFSKYKKLSIVTIYGGVAFDPQANKLQMADIVVGTPGRILDHIRQETVDFNNVDTLVLDEADRMFEMGFIEDVEDIIDHIPLERQTMLFSATIYGLVEGLAKNYLHEPVIVNAEERVDPQQLRQVYYNVPQNKKFSTLYTLLKHEDSNLAMIFCNSRINASFVAENLKNNGIKALAIHGGFSQDKRNKTLKRFHQNELQALVCTDVAARGLDIKGVTHVYNYDIPKESKQYIHRIGRTARAGEHGKAINILAPNDHDNYNRVLRDNNLTIPEAPMPKLEHVRVRRLDDNREELGGNRRGSDHRGPPRRGPPRRNGDRRGPPRRR